MYLVDNDKGCLFTLTQRAHGLLQPIAVSAAAFCTEHEASFKIPAIGLELKGKLIFGVQNLAQIPPQNN